MIASCVVNKRQLVTYTFAIIPVYMFFIYKNNSVQKKSIYLSLMSLILGILMGAIQLLPTSDFYKRSIRGEENYAASFNYGLSPIKESVRLMAADLFGNPARGNHFSPNSYHEYSGYLGALTLPLIAYLIFTGSLSPAIIFSSFPPFMRNNPYSFSFNPFLMAICRKATLCAFEPVK